jgi:hypothetical protein
MGRSARSDAGAVQVRCKFVRFSAAGQVSALAKFVSALLVSVTRPLLITTSIFFDRAFDSPMRTHAYVLSTLLKGRDQRGVHVKTPAVAGAACSKRGLVPDWAVVS